MSWYHQSLQDSRPDSGWSWIVAVCCCVVTFGSFGINRASGVYYVGVRESFGVSREAASWPFSICGAVNCFSGLITGFLFHFFSLRHVIIGGLSLSSIGLFLCYFATDISWIIASYGVIFGLGIGFTIVSMPLVINQYFVKHKASGNGIYMAGGTLASFFIPPLAEFFLERYDLKGTFLLTSAIPIQALVFACLLKSRKPQEAIKKGRLVSEANLDDEEVKQNLNKADSEMGEDRAINGDQSIKEQLTPLHPNPEVVTRNGHFSEVYRSTTEQKITEKSFKETVLEVLRLSKRVLKNPMFAIVTFSNVSSHFLILTFSMIVVDLGLDKGMARSEAVALASVVAIPELVGRLCFGWVSDKGYVSRKQMLVAEEIFAGALLCIMTLTDNKYFLFTLCGLFGLALGNALILITVFYTQIVQPEELAISFALKHAFTGIAFLLRPALTGLFRDDIGSYSYLLWTLGALSIIAGAVWKIESYLHYSHTIQEVVKERKQNSANSRT